MFTFNWMELGSSKPVHWRGNHYHPTDEERKVRDQKLFVYRYNQGGEKSCWDNSTCPYPSLNSIQERMVTKKYHHDQFRNLGLGDVVMVGKERWRKHVRQLNLVSSIFSPSCLGRAD